MLLAITISLAGNIPNSIYPLVSKICTEQEAVSEAIAELRPQLADLDASNKAKLEEGGMTITEYPAEFYDEILALDSVKALYEKIDADVNGLGTALQNALA